MVVNYQNGKIYKIEPINGEEGDVYVGSTTNEHLSTRMGQHRTHYKQWKVGTKGMTTSFILFDKYGVDACKIILIQSFSCNSKNELTSKEAEFIKTLKCVNKLIPNRTDKEYYQDNKEKIAANAKIYFLANKEKIAATHKQYRTDNRELIIASNKLYNEANKDVLATQKKLYREINKDVIASKQKIYNEAKKETVHAKNKTNRLICECGVNCRLADKSKHYKTAAHLAFTAANQIV